VRGIEARGVLAQCDAVLSGYLGSAEQGARVLEVVKRVKASNPAALYVCDPVMGHPEKGCVVSPGVQKFHTDMAATAADILCPNVLELGVMTGTSPSTPAEVFAAAQKLLEKGPKMVLVKHLAHAGFSPTDSFEMLLVEPSEAWHIAVPLIPFEKPPVGVGDLTTAIFLVNLLLERTPRFALEHTASAYMEVMKATYDSGQYELQLVEAQDGIASPSRLFEAKSLLPDETDADEK